MITAIIKSYINTPYQHQARLKSVGVDCAGLIVCVAQELGIKLNGTYTDYTMQPDGFRLIQVCKENLQEVQSGQEQPGDVLLMRFMTDPQHLAFLVEDNEIVHAYMRARKVVQHKLDETWRQRIVAVYRFKEQIK